MKKPVANPLKTNILSNNPLLKTSTNKKPTKVKKLFDSSDEN